MRLKGKIMTGLFCCALLTGCSMDYVGNALQDVDYPMINSEKDVNDAIEKVSAEILKDNGWVVCQDRQQKVKALKQIVHKFGEEESVKISNHSLIDDWADMTEYSVYEDISAESGTAYWKIRVSDAGVYQKLFEQIEALGYTGVKEMAAGSGEEKEVHRDCKGISFDVKNNAKNGGGILTITVPRAYVYCPKSLQNVLDDMFERDIFVYDVLGSSYLQAVWISTSQSLSRTTYNKDMIMYFKDGKLLQTDMRIELIGDNNSEREMFTEAEAKEFAYLTSLFGVGEQQAQKFYQGLAWDSDNGEGTLGNAKWSLKGYSSESWDSGLQLYWDLRIQP